MSRVIVTVMCAGTSGSQVVSQDGARHSSPPPSVSPPSPAGSSIPPWVRVLLPPGERPPSTEDPAVNAAAPARILAWAGGGDLDAITAAVEGKLLFAEDAVLRLAAAFGAIPDGELEEWVFGPLEEYRPE